MKMKRKKKPTPEKWAMRTRTAFLFFPKKIGDEWRWWETASWEEVYYPNSLISLNNWWWPTHWADN